MRRHLNEHQRAILLVQAAEKADGIRRGKDWRGDQDQHGPPAKSTVDLASEIGVGEVTIKRAKVVTRHPDLAQKVLSGRMPMAVAHEKAMEREGKRKPLPVFKRVPMPPEGKAIVKRLLEMSREVPRLERGIVAGVCHPVSAVISASTFEGDDAPATIRMIKPPATLRSSWRVADATAARGESRLAHRAARVKLRAAVCIWSA